METPQPITIKRLQTTQDAQRAYCCMTEVPTPWPAALCQCRDWIAENLSRHVEGYHLQAGDAIIGHVYYALSQQALFTYQVEPNVGILYCEWVQQRYQKQGLGKRVFERFLSDLKQNDVKGVLVEATDIEGQMHYGHYTARGFEIVHEAGHNRLLYLPLTSPAVEFRRREPRLRPRRGLPVEIILFQGFLCPYEVSTQILVRDVAQEFGNQIAVQEVRLTSESLGKYGIASGVLINGQRTLTGGESEEAIRRAILEALK